MDTSIRQGVNSMLEKFSLCIDEIDFKKAITIDAAYCYAVGRGQKYSMWKYIYRLFFPLQNKRFFEAFGKNGVCWDSVRA